MRVDGKTPPSRLLGIDIARAVAIVGMVSVHVGPRGDGSLSERLYSLPHGRASVLFVLLAGIGVSLLARSGSRGYLIARIGWLAMVFLPMGLCLQALDHGVAVILHHYALFYLAAFGLTMLPSRWLAGFTGLSLIVGPVVYLVLRQTHPDADFREAVGLGDGFGAILKGIVWTGPYPLLTWVGILACGLLVGRMDRRNPRSSWMLMVIGGGALLASGAMSAMGAAVLGVPQDPGTWRNLYSIAPHSQMTGWLVSAIGTALLVLGIMLELARRFPSAVHPLAMFGQLALSFYVAHLLVLAILPEVFRRTDVPGAIISVAALTGAGVWFAVVWRRHFNRGPLEALLALPFGTRGAGQAKRR